MAALVDVLLLVAFALTAVAGLRNGFFRELFSLIGLVLGVMGGMRFTGPILERAGIGFLQTDAGVAVIFVGVFLVIFALTVVAGGLLAHVWEGKSPSLVSRLVGLAVGAFRGWLLVVVLGGALVLLADEGSATLGRSRVLPMLGPGIEVAARVLPADLGARLESRWMALPFVPGWRDGALPI